MGEGASPYYLLYTGNLQGMCRLGIVKVNDKGYLEGQDGKMLSFGKALVSSGEPILFVAKACDSNGQILPNNKPLSAFYVPYPLIATNKLFPLLI